MCPLSRAVNHGGSLGAGHLLLELAKANQQRLRIHRLAQLADTYGPVACEER